MKVESEIRVDEREEEKKEMFYKKKEVVDAVKS